MLSLRKKLIIIGVAFVVVVAIITAIFACNSSSDNSGKGGTGGKPKDPFTCTVTFYLGDGTDGGRQYSVTIDKNTTVARPTKIPQRDGYMFWGWNATGNEDDPMWKFDVEKITDDMTIYAVWVKTYTVTLYANGGTFDDGDDMRTVTVIEGDKVPEPKLTPPNANMELNSWYLSGSSTWDLSRDVTSDIELYAIWDLKKDIKRALSPFMYYKKDDGGYNVYGVVDQNVSGTLTVPSVVTSIDYAAFANCPNIVSVIIDDSVTEIGHHAFQNCKNLKSVTLPSDLTSIEENTFEGCSSLEQIQLPDTLTELGSGAFYSCSSLKSIEIPSRVTDIGLAAFWNCSSLRQVKSGNNMTAIGDFAFYDCSMLQQVELGNNVIAIGACAFHSCSALQAVNLGSSVTTIGSSAFYECSALKEITMGDSVTTIGGYAFKGCASLASFDLPTVVEEIGEGAFEGCASLKSIVIPVACQNVGAYAFKDCTGITSVELHFAAVYHNNIFDGCTALADYILGDEVLQLGAAAFRNHINLRSVTIGDGLTAIPTEAFSNCYNLRSVTIGNGVKVIGPFAFYNCKSLLGIIIPSNVETVESSAFYLCSKLVEVYNLSDAAYNFGSSVTVHTDAKEESIIHHTDDGFTFGVINAPYYYPIRQKPFLLDYCVDSEDIVLPDSYNGDDYEIYAYAFAYNPKLKSVRFSAGVKGIGREILYGSDNVTSLTVDSGNTVYSSAGNCVIDTADKMFILGCKASVIPDDGSVTSIGGHVLCHNTAITKLSIPDSVTKIYQDAFSGCYGIIRTVGNVNYVDKWAVSLVNIYSGEGKVDLEFQSGTVGIVNLAFYGSSRILSVTFNDEMKYVGSMAFRGCEELASVTFNDGLVRIDGYAFEKCTKLQEVIIPDSVNDLGYGVFDGCTALTYAKLPAGITYIDRSVFDGCTALEGVVIPQSVEQMSYGILTDCPDTVKIYYCGTEQQWNAININNSNDVLINATKYYYSETEIAGVNCWHYGADGKPTTTY
ncbi:MAG: leucine-rich repeat protein [Clostridiales bacterium]|nr:leucine-rich repeat protein [Clostridiales bacterium]